jgi:hypothetical protein
MIPKFRAWIKPEKQMIEEDDLLDIDYDTEQIMTQQVYFVDGLPDDRDLKYHDFEDVELMQSTGLKDKNGQEIFVKDIVDYKGRKAVVKWHGSYASFIYKYVDELQKRVADWKPLYLSYYHFEVVGNVYQNPELLEVNHGRN